MLSICIPAFTMTPHLEDMAVKCIQSYRYYADEIVFSEDGGMFSPKILSLVDVYLYTKKNGGFTVNVNRAWRQATQRYVAIVSSDTYLLEGDPKELCIPGKVTSPEISNQVIPFLAGPFFVVPTEVERERGKLLEQMHTYCSDSEYDNRVRDIFVKVPQVKIFHHMAQTVTQAGVEGGKQARADQAMYEQLKAEGKAV